MFTRSMLPRFGRRPVRRLSSVRKWANICLLVCAVVVLSIVESLPVVANRFARLNRGEALWSENYGKRLAFAAYLMPYDPTYQMKLAIHYHALIEHTGEAAVYMPWIAHAYERAAELNPYKEEPAVQLARFFHVTGDYLSTIHSLEGSLVYLPMSPELHAWLIRAYIEAGHYERALEGLQQLSVLIPANASVHAKMEALYEKLGEYRAALRQAYYVLQKNPADVEMWDKIRYLKLRVAY
jgi:tetratricopeptide (TPR) repeat protein